MWLDDLVVIARVSHPIPFRTRTLNLFALMVLCLKTRESKSLPDLLTSCLLSFLIYNIRTSLDPVSSSPLDGIFLSVYPSNILAVYRGCTSPLQTA